MSEERQYAVITGDIIDFSNANAEEKDQLIDALKGAFKIIKKKFKSDQFSSSFDIFRGDSFQGVLANPGDALTAGLIIRSSLIKENENKKSDWDARLAIGVGTIEYLSENVSEGDGPAYRNSGPVLDNLKGEHKLAIRTTAENVDDEFNTSCALLDAIISKWTPAQAHIVFQLLLGKTQKEIGKELDISEAAVHYRVKASGWFAVKIFLDRYKKIMNTI